MALLTQDMHVVELSSFQALSTGGPQDPDWLARRFLTLVANSPKDEKRGGSGRIAKVSNCFGETFALKTALEPEGSVPGRPQDPAAVGRRRAFLEEFKAHLSVSGISGVPELYGLGKLGGAPAVLMEWVEGHTLDSAARTFPRPPRGRGHSGAAVAAAGVAVARVLLEARGRAPGFVHRDISPRNVMLRGSVPLIGQQVALLDFDACLIDMGSSIATPDHAASITMSADIWRFGTPEYAAPEMLTADIDDIERLRDSPSIDVYALCSVLYELYAGYAPYDIEGNLVRLGMSPYQMKRRFGPINLQLHSPQDRQLAQLMMAGINPDQGARISLEELYDGLCALLGRHGMTAAQIIASTRPMPKPRALHIHSAQTRGGGQRIDRPLPPALVAQMRVA